MTKNKIVLLILIIFNYSLLYSQNSVKPKVLIITTGGTTTIKYFLDRGIERSRIIARGFGEGFIINRCTDGTHCVEEDHTLNRRAELTVEAELLEEELEDNRN